MGERESHSSSRLSLKPRAPAKHPFFLHALAGSGTPPVLFDIHTTLGQPDDAPEKLTTSVFLLLSLCGEVGTVGCMGRGSFVGQLLD